MPPQPKFKSAHWKGIVRPDLAQEGELSTLLVRLHKDLADDVAMATYEDRSRFASEEEFIATAILYANKSIAKSFDGQLCGSR